MKFRFSPYNSTDLVRIAMRELELEQKEDILAMRECYDAGPALTAWSDGRAVGCGGVMILKTGVGQAWMVASEELFVSWHFPCLIHHFLYKIIEDFKLHRVHAFADCRHPKYGRFLEFLGMKFEGLHRQLGPAKSDVATYAWVR